MADRKRYQTKDYWLGIVSRMHIYDSFYESLVKTLLFLIAFLVSVLPLFIGDATELSLDSDAMTTQSETVKISELTMSQPQEDVLIAEIDNISQTDSKTAAGGALIVYGISLIAEVCMLLDPNNFLSRKLLRGTILLIGVIMMAFGFVQIFIPQLSVHPLVITVFGSFSVLIYVFDTVAFYLAKPPNGTSSNGQESKLKNIRVGV